MPNRRSTWPRTPSRDPVPQTVAHTIIQAQDKDDTDEDEHDSRM